MVENIESKRIGERSIDFYSLRVLNDNSVIMVPTANAESVGIRPVISSIQCKQLIARLSADFEAISSDWKTRSRHFTEQLHRASFRTQRMCKNLVPEPRTEAGSRATLLRK